MRVQEPGQHPGKPGMTLDKVASTGEDEPDACHPLGDVIGRRLEDSAVTAGHDQDRDTAGGKEPPGRIGCPGRHRGPQQLNPGGQLVGIVRRLGRPAHQVHERGEEFRGLQRTRGPQRGHLANPITNFGDPVH